MIVQAMRRAAQIRAGNMATICGDRRRTWAEFAQRTSRLAAGLRSLGVKPGDRVAILGMNSDAYLEAIYAILSCRAAMVPMNIRWALQEHVYSIDDADVGLVFADDAHSAMISQIASERPHLTVIHMDHAQVGTSAITCESLIEGSQPVEDLAGGDMNDLAGIFYTGGTTGHPKGVMHSIQSLWAGATSLAVDSRIWAGPCYLHAVPMFHLGDLAQSFIMTGLAGTHVFIPGFSASSVIEAVRAHHVEIINLVPTMIGMLLDDPSFDPADFESLRILKYGGSPASDTLVEKARRAFPNAQLIQSFGQTETAACGTSLHHEDSWIGEVEPKRRSAGPAHYGCEIAVFDSAGVRQAAGTNGEVWIHTPSAMMGYWKRPDLTASTLTNGWVHTGDVGYLNDDGYLYLCDRVKDMIISGGENVFSAEVENAIASHPAVAQVAVIGIPDERWGEKVHAVVVCRPNSTVDLDELQSHCRGLIAGYKLPRSLDIRDQPLPLSAVGKVLKTVLRQPYWDGKERAIS